MRLHIIERFVADSAGQRGITCHNHTMLVAPAQIPSHRHPEPSGKRRSRVTGSVTIVLAFCAQKKTIQSAVLPHRGKAIETTGEHFVHVTLMADVHDKAVARRVENPMQRDSQLDYAKIWAKMSASLG